MEITQLVVVEQGWLEVDMSPKSGVSVDQAAAMDALCT